MMSTLHDSLIHGSVTYFKKCIAVVVAIPFKLIVCVFQCMGYVPPYTYQVHYTKLTSEVYTRKYIIH